MHVSKGTTSATGNMFHHLGTMYDVIQVMVVILLYAIAVITVFNAIRERCKNRWLIILCMVVGLSLQTVYLMAPHRTRFLGVSQTFSYRAGNVSDPLTESRGGIAEINDASAKTEARSPKVNGYVLEFGNQNDEFTDGLYSNRVDAETTTVRSSNNDRSFQDYSCADLRLVALTHYGVLCMALLLASVRQNVSKQRHTTVRCGVSIYVVILTGAIAFLYVLKTSENTDIFSIGTASDSLELAVCAQDARSQFLPVFLETVCLFGPSIGMLLFIFYKKTGGNADRRFGVFKECRAAHEDECTACGSLNEMLSSVLMLYVFILLGVRPFHYIYTFVKHSQFYDVWVIACVIIIYATVSVNNVWNIISHKLDCKEKSVPNEEEQSPDEKKNITLLV